MSGRCVGTPQSVCVRELRRLLHLSLFVLFQGVETSGTCVGVETSGTCVGTPQYVCVGCFIGS